ncbi:hypothetical protein TL16_g10377 [Triparma laevis f. inornata]|uniref:Protein kinase domain-containing protein n=1 Tax=Triparma laevis f. inornata TaxID=1714386 RepID=A0A9W7EQF8_9STRA|nr:hypothetical protein TL16_g10377 [Triparma laevis f. inornata]
MNSKFTSLLNKNKKWASKVLKTGIEGAAALKETEIFHNVPIVHNILAGASLLNGIIDGREEEDDSLNEVKATVQLVSPIVVKIGQATVDLDDDDLNKNLAAMSGILEKIWDDVNDYIESDVFQKITSSGSKKFSSDLHTLRQALDNLSFTITGLSFVAVLRIEGKVDNIALGAYATQKAVEVVNDKLDAQGVTAEYTMKAVDRVDKTTRQTKQSIDRVDETTRQTKQSIKDVHYKLDAQGEATLQAVDRFDEKLGALGEKKTVEQRRDSRGLDLTLVESDLNIEKEPFAHGSFGNIYRAKFEDVVVVAKMISLKDVPPKAHESTKRMFKKEVALMGSLRSNFTAQIFGAGEIPLTRKLTASLLDCSYTSTPIVTRPTELILVMEYCEGGDLRGKLDRALAGEETFDHPEAVKMLLNIAHGMKYLHDKTIIHKDLKSLNVLVDEKGRGKVADFGGSFSSSMSSSTSMRSSAGGSGVGTYAWSAPEVLKNGAEALSLKADVFSFAVIIWECTTLQRPWVGKTDSQITIAAATGERPEVDDAMDPDLKGIMEKCWQQDPKARPHFEVIVKWLQDFVKVSASLADHQLDRSLSVSSSTTTTSTASRSVRRTSSFARLSANFSGMGLLQHGRSTSASSTASSKSRSVANPALELWIEIMSEAGVEESSTSHPWNENLVTAIEVHLFDGNDMEAEAAVSLKGALCKKGGDEASLNSWKKFYTKWKKSEHADIIIPYLAELQESSSRTVMGGLKSMVAGSFRKRGSSIAMASPPTVNVNPKDVPKSSETARLEAALLEAKKNKDRAKMKSVKAELSASKENDLKTHTFILEKAKLVKKVADLQKKLDEAWEADEEELIDKYDEMIQSATDSLNNIRKFLAKKFGKRTDADIMAAVKEWFIDSIEAEDKYGHISFWDTSAVTSMKGLFDAQDGPGEPAKHFNEDISSWNVENVKNMKYMFYEARSFSQDLSKWNVENCTDMDDMLKSAFSFDLETIEDWANKPADWEKDFEELRKWKAERKFGNRNLKVAVKEWCNKRSDAEVKYGHISGWDVSEVTSMKELFYGLGKFNDDITRWNVESAADMSSMLSGARLFDYDLSCWNAENCKDISTIFHHKQPPKPEDMNDTLLLTQLAAFKSAPRRNESSVDGINTFNPAEFVRGGMSKFALRNLLPHKDFSTPPPNPVVTEPGAEAQRPTDDLFKQQLERKEYEEKHSNLRLNSSIFAPVHTFFATSTIRSFLKELADDEKLLNIYMGTSEGGVDGNLSNLRLTYHEAGEEEKKTFEPEGWLRPEGFEPLDTSDADKYWDHFNNIHNITLLSEEEIEELTEFAANIVFADLPFMYCSSQEPMYGEYCNECFIPTEETPVLWEELSADTISNDELTAEQEKTITFRASREPFSVQQRRRKIESYFAENYGSNSAETEGYCWDIKDVEEAVTEEAHLKICEENKAREEKALQELADSNLIEFTEEEKAMYKKRAARRGVNPKFALFAKPVVRAVTLEEHLAICFDNVMELFRVLEEREKEGEKVVEFPKMGKWTKKVWKIPKIFLENLERQQNSLMTTSQGGT